MATNIARKNFKIRLHCTDICNQYCDYCHVFSENKESWPQPKMMSFETAQKIIDRMFEYIPSESALQISFYGGEPLTNWKVVKSTIEYTQKIMPGWHQDKLYSKYEWNSNKKG